MLQDFLDDVAADRAHVPLARTFDLDGIVEAHTLMEHGSAGGKLVVTIDVGDDPKDGMNRER